LDEADRPMTLEASLGERHSTAQQRRVKKWKVSVSFVILLNVSSLFWTRLEPAHGNSVYCFIACAL
jgi:hypothetical protein